MTRRVGDFGIGWGAWFGIWLPSIAANPLNESADKEAITTSRSQKPATAALMTHGKPHYERAMLAVLLDVVRREVTPDTFQAFELVAIRGLSGDQAAKITGLSRNAVYLSAEARVRAAASDSVRRTARTDSFISASRRRWRCVRRATWSGR